VVDSLAPATQLAGAVGGSVVRGLAGLDSWLEGNKLLPELQPLEVPEAVRDESGQLNAECKEVRGANDEGQHTVGQFGKCRLD